MPTQIVMPQLGESVAEGVIGKWLKNEGDSIAKDEPIVEVITDKVNAEIPSPVAGILEKITQPEGATVAVGQEIAIIGDEGGQRASSPSDSRSEYHQEVASSQAPIGGNGQQPAYQGTPSSPVATATAPPTMAGTRSERSERVRSSPLVRRLAEQFSINLSDVSGTGIGGRVSKQDILAFVEQRERGVQGATAVQAPPQPQTQPAAPQVAPAPPAPAPAAQAPPSPKPQPAAARQPGPSEELVPLSGLRKMIADRMVLSTSTIPHATTMSDVDVTAVVSYRNAHKDDFRAREGVPLSYVAFVIKATVEALKDFPLVNSEWADGNLLVKKDININIAVDAPEGLTTPVIHHADERSLAGISKAIYDLANRGRDRQLKIEDMQGGTFTVNNTGALGSVAGVSIINYPQAAILSAAAIVKRPVVLEQDGEDVMAIRSMMNLSFTFDHRIMDGGYATGFVNLVKQKLENWPREYPLY